MVLAATGRSQELSVYGSLSGRRAYLGPPPASAEAPAATPDAEGEAGPDQLTAERLTAERLYWDSVKDSDDPVEIQIYLDRYPNGTYAALAGVRLERLKREAGSASAGAAPAPEAPAPTGRSTNSALPHSASPTGSRRWQTPKKRERGKAWRRPPTLSFKLPCTLV